MTSVDSDDSIRFSWAGVVDDALAGTGTCVGIDLDLADLFMKRTESQPYSFGRETHRRHAAGDQDPPKFSSAC
jgi:hypothetical protein